MNDFDILILCGHCFCFRDDKTIRSVCNISTLFIMVLTKEYLVDEFSMGAFKRDFSLAVGEYHFLIK